MTEREVKQALGITEMYELNIKLRNVLPDKNARERYFDEVVDAGVDLKTDFIRDIYQEESSQRKQLKQDYTPDSLCELFYELSQHKDTVFDECAGTGSLSISYIAHGTKNVTCIEKSETVFPLLMFNLAIRNISGLLVKEDIITRNVAEVYRLQAGDKYSDIHRDEEYHQQVRTIISNPPYSLAWNGIPDVRMEGYGIPPKSKADYLFVLDILDRLQEDGEAYILLPHGVLFRGNQEGEIRQQLIKRGYIHGIIGLPDNMFLNTSIPTVMLCIRKQPTDMVYIMDATGYAAKEGKVNKLSTASIKNIAESYKNKTEITKVARLVGLKEIQSNGYNLNIPRYIDISEPEILPDLKEVVSDILQTDAEIRKTEQELAGMMRELVGENYQNDMKEVLRLWS